MKYYDYAIVFAEIPDEITIALDITSCPHMCKNCHSPWLREDKGIEVTQEELKKIVKKYPGATCICFMGGDANIDDVYKYSKWIHNNLKLKTAMYSGNEELDLKLLGELDYYKIGPYIEKKGPLNDPNTNQIMYKKAGDTHVDITYRFQEKPFK